MQSYYRSTGNSSGKLCFPTFVQALSLSNSLAGGQHHDWRFTIETTSVAAVGTVAAGGPQELMDMAEAALGATLSVKTESEMRNIVHVMRLDIIADERLPP